MKRILRTFVSALLAAATGIAAAHAQTGAPKASAAGDWPRWRGRNGDGIAARKLYLRDQDELHCYDLTRK